MVSEFKKTYVKFVVDVVAPISPIISGATVSAADRLMAGSRRQSQLEHQRRMPQLPKPKNPSSTKKDALRNHIILVEFAYYLCAHCGSSDCTVIDSLSALYYRPVTLV